jgi:hypothetical protein
MSWELLMFSIVILLFILLSLDIWNPLAYFKEGFMTSPGDNQFLLTYFPRRGDISFGSDDSRYNQENRHVMGYADVQRLGAKYDFCRMLVPKGSNDESQMFFACALAGTENLDSTAFRTATVQNGFRTSRDDYMRDVDKDGKSDYCAVVKMPGGRFEAQCYRALSTTFDSRQMIDSEPPEDIAEIVYFYEGIMFWFRFIDDMKDYAENLTTYTSGDLRIDEVSVKTLPSQIMDKETKTTTMDDRIQVTDGLQFNGINQFIRLGDSPDMSFGKKISLPTLKAICFWVRFDEFTNNAHILDFGNGAGIDNIFIGIVGRGDQSLDDSSELRKTEDTCVIPEPPSGPQPVPDMSPQALMLSTANVDEYIYDKEIFPRKLPPIKPFSNAKAQAHGNPKTATLIYEVWNGKLRMEHVNVLKAFELRKWTHCCITTASGDSVRPALQIWINGIKMAEKQGTHLPQTSITSNNYFGKNNWMSDSSQFENKPELFRGGLFDFRGYSQPMATGKLKKTIEWGKKRLGV